MTAGILIRPAVAADNPQLLQILRTVAVVTPAESYRLEREPDALALNRFQGVDSRLIVAGRGDEILGLISLALDRVWLDGEPRVVAYSGELKVLERARGLGLGQKLQLASLDACGDLPLFNTVMLANPVGMRMNRYLTEAGHKPVQIIGEVVTCFWPTLAGSLPQRFGVSSGVSSGVRVRSATPADYPAMYELWREVARRRHLARAYDPEEWVNPGRMPPLRPQDWLLAYAGGELQGFVGIWDQRALRQVRLLDPGPVTRLLGWHAQRAMPLGHCLHLCLRPQARRQLPALLLAALRAAQARGLTILTLALDAQDPLLEQLSQPLRSLGSFGRMHLCSNQPPRRAWPFHLEMSLG